MDFTWITAIANRVSSAFKGLSETTDPHKVVSVRNEDFAPYEANYNEMRRIISESKELDDIAKLNALKSINDDIEARRQRTDETVLQYRRETSETFLKTLQGFLTLGVSFAPEMIKHYKAMVAEMDGGLSLYVPIDEEGHSLK